LTETGGEEGNVSTPLHCLPCGKELTLTCLGDGVQCDNATIFEASGNYGSTVWDLVPEGEKLLINVCDDCLKRLSHLVTHARVTRPRPEVRYRSWRELRALREE